MTCGARGLREFLWQEQGPSLRVRKKLRPLWWRVYWNAFWSAQASVRDSVKGNLGKRVPSSTLLVCGLRANSIWGAESGVHLIRIGLLVYTFYSRLQGHRKPQSCSLSRSLSLLALSYVPPYPGLCPRWYPPQPSVKMLLNLLVILTTEETATC